MSLQKTSVKIAACQVPDLREDIEASLSCINAFAREAESQEVKLLCFPECFLQGYLVEEKAARYNAIDLDSPAFKKILEQLAAIESMLVIGMIEKEGNRLFNSAVVIDHGKLLGRYRKTHLLSGEKIIFDKGREYPIFEVDGLRFGINICYDTNFPEAAHAIAEQGAALIVCPSNNMMRLEKSEAFKWVHNKVRGERCKETGCWLISSDVRGEIDGKISYGPTAVIDPNGSVVAQVPLPEIGMISMEIPIRC